MSQKLANLVLLYVASTQSTVIFKMYFMNLLLHIIMMDIHKFLYYIFMNIRYIAGSYVMRVHPIIIGMTPLSGSGVGVDVVVLFESPSVSVHKPRSPLVVGS